MDVIFLLMTVLICQKNSDKRSGNGEETCPPADRPSDRATERPKKTINRSTRLRNGTEGQIKSSKAIVRQIIHIKDDHVLNLTGKLWMRLFPCGHQRRWALHRRKIAHACVSGLFFSPSFFKTTEAQGTRRGHIFRAGITDSIYLYLSEIYTGYNKSSFPTWYPAVSTHPLHVKTHS